MARFLWSSDDQINGIPLYEILSAGYFSLLCCVCYRCFEPTSVFVFTRYMAMQTAFRVFL